MEISRGNGTFTRSEFKVEPKVGRILDALNTVRGPPAWVEQAKAHSFKHEAVQMWNLLPQHIRNTTNVTVDKFKAKLDKYLQTIVDQPRIPSMTSQCLTTSNCLQSIIPISEAQHIQIGARHIDVNNDQTKGGDTLTSTH